jgi:hypothetical protein
MGSPTLFIFFVSPFGQRERLGHRLLLVGSFILSIGFQRKVNRRMRRCVLRLRAGQDDMAPHGLLQAFQLRKQLQRIQDLSDLLKGVQLLSIQHPSCL